MNVLTYTPYGSEGIIIRVEADIRRGIPGIDITGLAEGAVREARERVRAAFRNSGFSFPADRILINLAPAGVRKEGAALDLPIALAVMHAAGIIPQASFNGDCMVLGELELSGKLRPVRGVLAAAAAGLKAGIHDFIIPADNAQEASILDSGSYAPAATLGEAVHALMIRGKTGSFPGWKAPETGNAQGRARENPPIPVDFRDVKGQGRYKRALEIAAAGGHNLLAFGPPGVGKTMLARALPSILPPLESWEAVETARIQSLAGQSGRIDAAISTPPFRAPHHSASLEGILGGGRTVRPGEISLANFGILFLDEAPEFRSNLLQALREPLEDRVITISRAEGSVRLPADFQLVLTANACPCGRLGIPLRQESRDDDCSEEVEAPTDPAQLAIGGFCFCTDEEIRRYWRKLSGPLLDRIELRVPVARQKPEELMRASEESSSEIAQRILQAVRMQKERFKNTGIRRNARIPPNSLAAHCPLGEEAAGVLKIALEKLGLSGRAYHGILRTARTIADLEGAEAIGSIHVLEAVEHRRLGDDPFDIMAVSSG